MLALFLLIAWSSHLLSVHFVNAGRQYVSYDVPMMCYQEYSTARWVTTLRSWFIDTAMCEFPTHIQRNNVYYNYSVVPFNSEDTYFAAPQIRYNETITRFSADEPLKYVVESENNVNVYLERFNGYHARQLILNLHYPTVDELANDSRYSGPINKCDGYGGYTQKMRISSYLVVYPKLFSEHRVNEIRTNLTFIGDNYDSMTPAMKDPKTFFTTTLNSTGMICYGEGFSTFYTNY